MTQNLNSLNIAVIIPAYNEAESIALVLKDLPRYVNDIIVVDNNSTDKTATIALEHGVTVLKEHRRGYGYACLKGIEHLKKHPPDVVVFIDADYADNPKELSYLLKPIVENNIDFCVGSRKKKFREKGAMKFHQHLGNLIACLLMNIFFKSNFTDLGPFRVIKWQALQKINMKDTNYGWTVEMQLKVLTNNLTYTEVPVSYKRRLGTSKVSGSIKGSILAGIKIIGWIIIHYFVHESPN